MIPESKIQAHIEGALEAKMEGMGPEALEDYRPKEYNILPDVMEALDKKGHENLDSEMFQQRLTATFNDVLDSCWYGQRLEDAIHEAWQQRRLNRNPYHERGISKGDF